MEKGVIQANKKLKIGKTRCGIQEETEADQVVTTLHLLQLKESKTEPKHLGAGKVVAVRIQGM